MAAAARIRRALRPDGIFMLVEASRGPPAGGQPGAAALGAQAGPALLEKVLREAGFSQVRVAMEAPFNLVMEARP